MDTYILRVPVYPSEHLIARVAELCCVFEYFLLHPKYYMSHEQRVAEITQMCITRQ